MGEMETKQKSQLRPGRFRQVLTNIKGEGKEFVRSRGKVSGTEIKETLLFPLNQIIKIKEFIKRRLIHNKQKENV